MYNKDIVKVIEGLAYVSDYLFSQPPSCAVYDGRMNFECLNALGCIYSLYGGACTPLSIGMESYNAENSTFQMYPNPNNGSFIIELQNSAKAGQCTLYDVNGKAELSQTIIGKTIIDANSLNEGVYNISLISSEGVLNKRLVIVR